MLIALKNKEGVPCTVQVQKGIWPLACVQSGRHHLFFPTDRKRADPIRCSSSRFVQISSQLPLTVILITTEEEQHTSSTFILFKEINEQVSSVKSRSNLVQNNSRNINTNRHQQIKQNQTAQHTTAILARVKVHLLPPESNCNRVCVILCHTFKYGIESDRY